MNRLAALLLLLLVMSRADAQRLRLNAPITADTLLVALYFEPDADTLVRQQMETAWLAALQRFQQSNPAIIVVPAAAGSAADISLYAGATSYSSSRESVWATVANGILIGGHTFMIVRFGWTIPLLYFAGPSTFTQLRVNFSPAVVQEKNRKTDFTLSSGAYFASQQRQQKRTVRSFEQTVYHLLRKINRRSAE